MTVEVIQIVVTGVVDRNRIPALPPEQAIQWQIERFREQITQGNIDRADLANFGACPASELNRHKQVVPDCFHVPRTAPKKPWSEIIEHHCTLNRAGRTSFA